MQIGPGMLGDAVAMVATAGIDEAAVTTLKTAATALDTAALDLDQFAKAFGSAAVPGGGGGSARQGAQLLTIVADDATRRLVARGDREVMLIFTPEQKQQINSIAEMIRELEI